MKIFYINIDELKTISKEELESYADIKINSEKRFYEHAAGRFLVKNVAKKYYGISDTQIIVDKNGKPYFKDADLHFCISHSGKIVTACFDDYPCGIDIEMMKPRNISKFEKYYDKHFEDEEAFYKFWTTKEAEYKLNNKSNSIFHTKTDNYYMTVVSTNPLNTPISAEKYLLSS